MTGFRTILFNLVMGAIMVVVQKYNFELTNEDLLPLVEAIVGAFTIIGNLILRWFTNTTVFKSTSPAPMPESPND